MTVSDILQTENLPPYPCPVPLLVYHLSTANPWSKTVNFSLFFHYTLLVPPILKTFLFLLFPFSCMIHWFLYWTTLMGYSSFLKTSYCCKVFLSKTFSQDLLFIVGDTTHDLLPIFDGKLSVVGYYYIKVDFCWLNNTGQIALLIDLIWGKKLS